MNEMTTPHYRIFDAHMHVNGIYLVDEAGTKCELIKYLDRFGIERALVNPLHTEASAKTMTRMLMTDTNWEVTFPLDEGILNTPIDHGPVRQLVERYPDRIVGSYWFNPKDKNPEEEFHALAEAIDNWGFRAVKIQSAIHRGRVPEDLDRLAEFCVSRDVPLFIHLTPPFFNFPGVRAFDILKLAKLYSKLKILIGHFAYAMEESIQSCVVATLRSNIFLDTSLGIPLGIYYGYKFVGPKRVIYGSDSPTTAPPSMELEKIYLLKIPATEKQAILYNNIAKLVGVDD